MKRKIITINEDLCNGCGDCVIGCSEGALQIVNGKAKLVREDFCDGFGDCVGACPTGALIIEERDSVAFDEEATKQNLLKTQGAEAVKKMESAQAKHNGIHRSHGIEHKQASALADGHHHHGGGGCPGSKARDLASEKKRSSSISNSSTIGMSAIPSELQQWPVQLHLVSPHAPYFNEKELVVLSTCSPVASADIHWRYLRGRSVVVACPKLDDTSSYIEKLSEIFKANQIPKVIVVIMEVPCCRGLSMLVKEAKARSGTLTIVEEHIMQLQGNLLQINTF
ncbi:MAG: hypothetical protein A2504_13440 [Bdellovibrionales bacterium RIFOXYD12_FULL_39_22]|nr:MAG: hypothetical protein A2385_01240 [Bdellovibrionales bacterium RIFOXYB1_FULL_39_21]OFZ43630.1 MAG: hypothetical protein A2485_12910 [Bdellovibrionales bacterium RIFOXYC12_FULL_39_17]OFZ44649.1 MAG: hypothetical protein A2404_10600 [Bdellovibrionales bacterium RIFOXYC1_FULL_39_130]OFZ73059.1 MAG: hypothetical protein A2451_16125 [Bdellovibrionales bacterium RIFOXYC2_FULL_39_8]OFZ76408.1 MAG: hypothetical protein A2560_07220 [Bdellovibrionales bacterium RIFOXYD1_FULL_39_84]OFZ94674.1 MAG: